MLTSIIQLLLIVVLLVLTALFLLRQYLPWFRYARACRKWPHAMGKITVAPGSEDSGSFFSRPGFGRGIPEIRYSFLVDGKEYEGNNVSFDPEIEETPPCGGGFPSTMRSVKRSPCTMIRRIPACRCSSHRHIKMKSETVTSDVRHTGYFGFGFSSDFCFTSAFCFSSGFCFVSGFCFSSGFFLSSSVSSRTLPI